ncbi:hypothetical protein [Hyphomonas sp.]|uniref:hypothetical protein n=1 Tax=Hyphomonas sp. TaxID=87 RepID=UPI00391C7D71
MTHDVFLVACVADRDTARLIARRLRALKFKVSFNQTHTDESFEPKDARDSANSQSVLVLWSAEAVKSDWVRAAAAIGHSRADVLIHAALDRTIPYEPYRQEKRFALEGLTSRKAPEGFFQLVEELGRRDGRVGLKEWMKFGAKDDEKRAAWMAANPNDPISQDARRKREKDLGLKPAPAREAIGAAALAAASLKANGTKSPAPPPAPAPMPGAQVVRNPLEELGVGWGTMAGVSAAIVGMLVLAWVFRSEPASQADMAVQSRAIANARLPAAVCPAGTVPRGLLTVLEPGPIIDDTQPMIIDDTETPETGGG